MKKPFVLLCLVVLPIVCNNQIMAKQSELNFNLRTALDKNQKAWVEKILSELSIREMTGQVVLEWTAGNYICVESDDFDNEIKVVESGIGGIWLMGGSPFERAARANELQKHAKIPLLVLDSEAFGKKQFANYGGRLWLRGGGTDIPPALAYGAIGDTIAAKEAAKIIGLEARATGLHITCDPDATVLLNLDNVLHNRTLGDDPEQVAQLVSVIIAGAHESGALTISGFFPGAGSLGTDPHNEIAIAQDDKHTFDSIHFVPFRAAIKAGADMIITSHIATPGLTGSETLPATLSPKITRILREELGYDGILITDAMDMGAITKNYDFIEAAILAFKAGNDFILGTSSIKFADALAVLVEKGEIPIERLKASVRKILELKAKIGLHRERLVSLDKINTVVGHRANQLKADSAATRSIVLLRDRNNNVPVNDPSNHKALIITYEREGVYAQSAGKAFNGFMAKHVKSVDAARLSPSSVPSIYQDLLQRAQNVDQVIFCVYLRPRLGVKAQDKMTDSFIEFVKNVQLEGRKVILVSFGELEVLDNLPDLDTFMMAWSGQDVMQRAAAKALLGMKPISGRLPIGLPPHHKRGAGLKRKEVFAEINEK